MQTTVELTRSYLRFFRFLGEKSGRTLEEELEHQLKLNARQLAGQLNSSEVRELLGIEKDTMT